MADQITASLAQAKVLVMEGQRGADGKSPYIGTNGSWFVWNGADWVDTGVPAGMDEAAIEQAVEDYLDEHPVEVPVSSVNGKTGAVVLDASDVGALPDDTVIPAAVTVDSALSSTSENPVQNKVIKAALDAKGTYSKPSGGIPASDLTQAVQTSLGKADTAYQKPASGIPASDLASGVIPVVPQMATQTDMSDWTSGKTVDAAVLKTDFTSAVLTVNSLQVNKADKSELSPLQTKAITDAGGYFTTDTVDGALQEIGAELGDKADKVAVTASDNGKFLRVVNGAWAAQAVPSAESSSFGGGS